MVLPWKPNNVQDVGYGNGIKKVSHAFEAVRVKD